MQVVVVPFDDRWAMAYREEEASIVRALSELAHCLHHIGSTSIKNISAKPIIDMLLVVDSLQDLDREWHHLNTLGYEALGEYGIPGRRYFRKSDERGIRTHHLHAFERGSYGAKRHLAFRDYMNEHPGIAREYSQLKESLAAQFPWDAQAYCDGKDAFVKRHEAIAMQRWSVQHPS